jgi:hypothetical protein
MQQSSDSLQQTIDAGGVSQERAQRILDNDNINKKEDQIKKLESTGAKMRTQVNNGGGNGGGHNGGGNGGNNGGSGGNP